MMRLPSFGKDAGIDFNIIKENANAYTTMFAKAFFIIYSICLQAAAAVAALDYRYLKKLPMHKRRTCSSTRAIPAEYCHLIGATQTRQINQCTFIYDPQSILLFYSSDIPKTNRPTWPMTCPRRKNLLTINSSNDHCKEFHNSSYSLLSCGLHSEDYEVKLDIHVTRNETLLEERKSISLKSSSGADNMASGALPNIVLTFSRHFPAPFLPQRSHHQIFHTRNQRATMATPPHISADTAPNHSIQLAILILIA
jgi:hypothetical protein